MKLARTFHAQKKKTKLRLKFTRGRLVRGGFSCYLLIMRYQADLWFKPDATGDVLKKEFKDLAEAAQAQNLSNENRGKKKLAYQIKNFTEGYFCRVNFEAPSSKIEAARTTLDRSQNVLRYLLTKLKGESGEWKV